MSILDRYITRYFLINFAILLTVFLLLFVIGDVLVDMDEFIGSGWTRAVTQAVTQDASRLNIDIKVLVDLAKHKATAAQVVSELHVSMEDAKRLCIAFNPSGLTVFVRTVMMIFDFHGPMMLLVYVYFSGLIIVAAMGFTFASLAKSREIVAMLASGISMYRIAMPVFITGIFLSSLTILSQEFIIPHLADKLVRGKGEIRDYEIRHSPVYFAVDGAGKLFSASDFKLEKQKMTDLVVLERDDLSQVRSRVTADYAFWNKARGGWDLAQGLREYRALANDGQGGLLSPTQQKINFIKTDLSPTLLMTRRAAIYTKLLSIRQLQKLLHHPKVDRFAILQIMHSRLSMFVMNILILTMGMPFFLLRESDDLLKQGLKAACVCIGAWSSGLMLQQMGASFLNPVASAWLAVVLYLPASAYFLQTVKT